MCGIIILKNFRIYWKGRNKNKGNFKIDNIYYVVFVSFSVQNLIPYVSLTEQFITLRSNYASDCKTEFKYISNFSKLLQCGKLMQEQLCSVTEYINLKQCSIFSRHIYADSGKSLCSALPIIIDLEYITMMKMFTQILKLCRGINKKTIRISNQLS